MDRSIPTVGIEFGSARYSAVLVPYYIAGFYQLVLHGARIYSCTGTVLVECAHLHESDLSTFDLKLQYWYHRTSTTGSYQLSCTSTA